MKPTCSDHSEGNIVISEASQAAAPVRAGESSSCLKAKVAAAAITTPGTLGAWQGWEGGSLQQKEALIVLSSL